jgi:opacity protein-like surface antigen
MRKFWLLLILTVACPMGGLAQGSKDYNKFEVYGGFSASQAESTVTQASFTGLGGTQTFTNLCSPQTGDVIGPNFQSFFCTRRNFNGFDASATFNVTKYIGIKGNVTGHFRSQSYVDRFNPPGLTQTIVNKERLYHFLGGIQIKNNSTTKRAKPFAHALVGFARYTNRQSQDLDLFPFANFTIEDRETSFAMKLGGGIDLRAGKRFDVRVIEIDYNPIFAGNRNPRAIAGPFSVSFGGNTAHNFTIGIGLVIH